MPLLITGLALKKINDFKHRLQFSNKMCTHCENYFVLESTIKSWLQGLISILIDIAMFFNFCLAGVI